MSTWPVVKQVGGPSDLISAQTPSSVYVGCTPEHKAYCKPYLGYLSLLPTILQVPEVKESAYHPFQLHGLPCSFVNTPRMCLPQGLCPPCSFRLVTR